MCSVCLGTLLATRVLTVDEIYLQGGSQNVIFVASDYLTQRELYRLGLLTTVFCTLVFLFLGTPWVLWVGK
jgi:hypothetical protein